MELILLLLILATINFVGMRWGVDSRDGQDWMTFGSPVSSKTAGAVSIEELALTTGHPLL